MGIFHVLKWPISTPPTIEEIGALPFSIIEQWVEFVRLNSDNKFTDEISSAILRHLIRTYEDPV